MFVENEIIFKHLHKTFSLAYPQKQLKISVVKLENEPLTLSMYSGSLDMTRQNLRADCVRQNIPHLAYFSIYPHFLKEILYIWK